MQLQQALFMVTRLFCQLHVSSDWTCFCVVRICMCMLRGDNFTMSSRLSLSISSFWCLKICWKQKEVLAWDFIPACARQPNTEDVTWLLWFRCCRRWEFSPSNCFRSCTGNLTPSLKHCCTLACRLQVIRAISYTKAKTRTCGTGVLESSIKWILINEYQWGLQKKENKFKYTHINIYIAQLRSLPLFLSILKTYTEKILATKRPERKSESKQE